MQDYILSCESTADLSDAYFQERKIPYVSFTFHMDGQDYADDYGKSMPIGEFYRRMAEGSVSTTSQVSVGAYEHFWEPMLEAGKDVLHLSLSTGISGTLNSERSGMNVVVELQDRNTELSYQYMLADMMSRHHYFALWNQAVDQYDHDVRVFNNDGYEEGVPTYAFSPEGTGQGPISSSNISLAGVKVYVNGTNDKGAELTGTYTTYLNAGTVPSYEIDLAASQRRNFIITNIADYLPDKYKYNISGFDPETDNVDMGRKYENPSSCMSICPASSLVGAIIMALTVLPGFLSLVSRLSSGRM